MYMLKGICLHATAPTRSTDHCQGRLCAYWLVIELLLQRLLLHHPCMHTRAGATQAFHWRKTYRSATLGNSPRKVSAALRVPDDWLVPVPHISWPGCQYWPDLAAGRRPIVQSKTCVAAGRSLVPQANLWGQRLHEGLSAFGSNSTLSHTSKGP